MDQAFLTDPAPMLARMREECPVFYFEERGFWGITRYADINAALADFETFNQGAIRFPPVPEQFRDRIPDAFFSTAFTVLDPPEHTRYRKAGNTVLTRGRVRQFEGAMRQIANDLIDGFIADEACDLMDRYCYAMTISSMMLLMGLPVSDMPRLRQFAYDFAMIVQEDFMPMPPEERDQRWGLHAEVRAWFRETAAARHRSPENDIISELAQIEGADGCPMFDVERLATHMTEFLFGGTDTAANTMGTAVMLLDEHADQHRLVQADPALTANVVEEVLRLSAPTIGVWKTTTRDVEIGGYVIPDGSVVWLAVSSAGHDGAHFEDPERFDVCRRNAAEHLTFGKGRHFCLGAPLARAEATIGLQVLYERIPDLRVVPDTPYEYQPTAIVRVLERLPVVWGSRASALPAREE
jgi:cytochrome P450